MGKNSILEKTIIDAGLCQDVISLYHTHLFLPTGIHESVPRRTILYWYKVQQEVMEQLFKVKQPNVSPSVPVNSSCLVRILGGGVSDLGPAL